jgi:hypothetical protein
VAHGNLHDAVILGDVVKKDEHRANFAKRRPGLVKGYFAQFGNRDKHRRALDN